MRICPAYFYISTRTWVAHFLKKQRNTPAKACKSAKSRLTVFVGSFPNHFAPKTPPKITPIAVGISTDKETYPRHAYNEKDKRETGKITKIAVACACFSSKPVFCNNGTASIPPPPPNKLLAIPTKTPQAIRENFPFFPTFKPTHSLFTIL